jgi:PAS domain S-box-containing protein
MQLRAREDSSNSALLDAGTADRPLAYRIAVALLCVAGALGVRWVLDPWLGAHAPLSAIYPAVALASWLSGLVPATLAMLVGGMVGNALFVDPRGGLGYTSTAELVSGLLYFISCSVIIAGGVTLRRASRRAALLRAQGEAHRGRLEVEIADREGAQRELAQAHQRTTRILESITDAFYVVDREWRYTYLNAQAERYFGRTRESMLGKVLWEEFPVLVGSQFGAHYRLAMEENRQVHFEDLSPVTGRWLSVHVYPSPEGLSVFFQDVTERLQVAKELEAKESQLRNITDAVPALISYVDRDCRYRLNNGAYERWFGRPRSDITGRKMEDVLGDDAWKVIGPYVQAALKGETVSYEREVHYRDAGTRWIRAQYVPHLDQRGNVLGVVIMVDDVSAMKRTEVALRESLEEMRTLFDAAPVGIWIAHDARCRRVTGNQYANRLLNVTAGTNVARLDQAARPARIQVRRDGADVPAPELPLQRATATGRPVYSQELDLVVEGQGTVHLFGNAAPLFDEAGRVRGAIGVFVDASEQKRAEAALKQADRRKDEFLATLAHELRNPLAPIRNALQILRTPGAGEEDAQAARDMIDRQMQQMVRLIDDLLDVSRITSGKMRLRRERVSLHEVVRSAVETSRPLIERFGHQLHVTLPDAACTLDADPTRLAQVFSNLLTNAAKYTDAGGHIWLTAQREDDRVAVRVKDSGIGIAPEQLPHIFTMFSQVTPALERSHGGLGIGLSLARGLVQMHGGSIEASSDGVNKGSEFIVCLQAVDGEPPSRSLDLPAARSGADLRVLVVDDNVDACASLTTLLGLLGYQTRGAHDGVEAVGEAIAFRPDVVVLDIGLPRMNGYEAARQIRAHRPGAVMIALTGWGQEEDRRRAMEAGFDHHLTKPVDPAALLKLIGVQRAA